MFPIQILKARLLLLKAWLLLLKARLLLPLPIFLSEGTANVNSPAGTTIPNNVPAPLKSCAGDIKLENLHFSYPSKPNTEILKGINLHLKPKTTTALVGKSGGGKSTIVQLLMRFYEPTSGCIRIDGKALPTVNACDLRKHVGIVSQDPELFDISILENLLFGMENPEKVTKGEVIEACKMAHAHEFISKLDEGYMSRVGERGTKLSGGQKQRLALARCFLRKPKLLFLDEATSALDAESEALVQEGIDKLLQISDSTVLLIAHRLSTVMNANQIAVLSEGQVAELGTHDELIAVKKGIYANLVKRQMKKAAEIVSEEADDFAAASN